MTLTIEITPELEQQLKIAAEKAGLDPNTFVVQLLHQSLQPTTVQASTRKQLPKNEGQR